MESYDFENKRIYRQRRESAIDSALFGQRFKDRRVAYLDTREALDTISYLQRGYRPKNLWAINRNPAEVALLTSKLKSLGLPEINTVGLEFEEALERRVPEVDAIDFDGMSCLHDDLIAMLHRVFRSRPNCAFGITLLAGRETGKWKPNEESTFVSVFSAIDGDVETSFGTVINLNHRERLDTLLWEIACPRDSMTLKCSIHITALKWDCYLSTSRQPMLWCVVKVEPHRPLDFNQVRCLGRMTGCTPICGVTRIQNRAKEILQTPNAKETLLESFSATIKNPDNALRLSEVERQLRQKQLFQRSIDARSERP